MKEDFAGLKEWKKYEKKEMLRINNAHPVKKRFSIGLDGYWIAHFSSVPLYFYPTTGRWRYKNKTYSGGAEAVEEFINNIDPNPL